MVTLRALHFANIRRREFDFFLAGGASNDNVGSGHSKNGSRTIVHIGGVFEIENPFDDG